MIKHKLAAACLAFFVMGTQVSQVASAQVCTIPDNVLADPDLAYEWAQSDSAPFDENAVIIAVWDQHGPQVLNGKRRWLGAVMDMAWRSEDRNYGYNIYRGRETYAKIDAALEAVTNFAAVTLSDDLIGEYPPEGFLYDSAPDSLEHCTSRKRKKFKTCLYTKDQLASVEGLLAQNWKEGSHQYAGDKYWGRSEVWHAYRAMLVWKFHGRLALQDNPSLIGDLAYCYQYNTTCYGLGIYSAERKAVGLQLLDIYQASNQPLSDDELILPDGILRRHPQPKALAKSENTIGHCTQRSNVTRAQVAMIAGIFSHRQCEAVYKNVSRRLTENHYLVADTEMKFALDWEIAEQGGAQSCDAIPATEIQYAAQVEQQARLSEARAYTTEMERQGDLARQAGHTFYKGESVGTGAVSAVTGEAPEGPISTNEARRQAQERGTTTCQNTGGSNCDR